jgi:hypothetical protein
MEAIEGRNSEVVTLGDGRRRSALSVEGLFAAQLRRARQVQIVQTTPGDIKWRIAPFATADPDEIHRVLLERSAQVLGFAARVSVEFVERIARTEQGKFLRVVST